MTRHWQANTQNQNAGREQTTDGTDWLACAGTAMRVDQGSCSACSSIRMCSLSDFARRRGAASKQVSSRAQSPSLKGHPE